MSFYWWYEDPREFALWKKLNSLTPEERNLKKYAKIIKEKIYQYGHIYLFKPFPKQKEILLDSNDVIFVHGNNSSGKSWGAGAWSAYNIIGFNPYRPIKNEKNRLTWIFTPSFELQRNSSQQILFDEREGLLPSLKSIEDFGGKFSWFKKSADILDSVVLPDGKVIIFKSMEMKSLNIAGAGVNIVWGDECLPKHIYNEVMARLLKKEGKFIMSFIIDQNTLQDTNYVIKEVFSEYQNEIREKGRSDKSFYFLTIEDNLSYDKTTIEKRKKMVTETERSWRFSDEGQFVVQTKGLRVWGNYSDNLHKKRNLLEQYDPNQCLWRAWDRGRVHPCCVAAQVDDHGRVKILFCIMGTDVQLTNFIDDVEAKTKLYMPNLKFTFEILPHDSRRKTDIGDRPFSAEDIFHQKGLKKTEVLYVHKERSIEIINKEFERLIRGEPAIQIDEDYASLLCETLNYYTRNEKGELVMDGYYEHPSDAFKLLMTFLIRELKTQSFEEYKEKESLIPQYHLFEGI